MGVGNAQLVLLSWSRYLDDVPFRVAVQMALTSMDGAAEIRYWGGWGPLATAAGRSFPAACAPTPGVAGCRGCEGCRAARRCIDRAVKSLVSRGFCALVGRPRPGRNAEYRLFLMNPEGPAGERSRTRSQGFGASGRATQNVVQTCDTERGAAPTTERGATRDTERGAEEQPQEQPQEYRQEQGSSESPPHLRAVPEIPNPRDPQLAEVERQQRELAEWARNQKPEAS